MPRKRVLPDGIIDMEPIRPKKVPPRVVTFIAIMCTILAGLGDWGTINRLLKGLPKAIALGTIACAVMNYLVEADFANIKKALSYFPWYMLMIVIYAGISMYIWLSNLTNASSISAGVQRTFFQMITIIYAVCMCYLFEERAVDFLFLGMVITNAGIMLLEMPKYGIAESIISVVTCIVTFGGASGFVRAMEIHDITFLFGQFLIYYLMFAPRRTPTEKRRKYACAGICLFFMLVGLKRSTLPAVAVVCIYVAILQKMKKPEKLIMATGIGLFLFSYVYVYLARSGIMVEFMESMGIEMLGRDKLWTLPNDYYEFSPFWKGLGFEGVDDLINLFYQQGLITSTYPLHNDFLRVFIELGAVGFTLWSGVFYILYPIYWIKHHDTKTGMLYMALLCYMTVTYLTDNTAFYFWCCIGLRLIPMSYSYRIYKAKKMRKWKPPTAETAADLIWDIETGG